MVEGIVKQILKTKWSGGTRVINCVMHAGMPLDKRPDGCQLCLADLRNQFNYALSVNEFLNAKVDDALAAYTEREIIDEFSRLFYSKGALQAKIGGDDDELVRQLDASYYGYVIQKNPLDLWIYQELIWACRPDLIVEGGTASGASALFMAHCVDRYADEDNPAIISIDIDNRLAMVPKHPRIKYLVGDTLSPEICSIVRGRTAGKKRVMVVLDDDHSTDHVLREMRVYGTMVSKGQYMIVEDSNVDHPLCFHDGPGKAIKQFMEESTDFAIDKGREKFLMTWNPNGYFRRV